LLEAVLANLPGQRLQFTGKRADARIEFGAKSKRKVSAFSLCAIMAQLDMAYSQKLFGAFSVCTGFLNSPASGHRGWPTGSSASLHRHGGRVWAEAEVERGATIYFTFG